MRVPPCLPRRQRCRGATRRRGNRRRLHEPLHLLFLITEGAPSLYGKLLVPMFEELWAGALAGDPAVVGPTYVQQSLVAKARLDHGETAILAINRKEKEVRANSGVPFLRDIPVLGRFFRTDGSQVDQIRLVIAVRARRVSNPSELVADTIRRRLAFERRAARESNLPRVDGPPYGVRVTTRRIEDDARSIADALAYDGHATRVHGWHSDADDYWDVYVTGLVSMVDAGVVARELAEDGWETDLVVFSRRR